MADMWTIERDDEGIAWVGLDAPGKSTNTLDRQVLDAFETVISGFEKNPPNGIVLYSKKEAGFIAGADIEMLGELEEEVLRGVLEDGKALLDRFEALPCASVAMIHGHCLGGGLEVALACDRRVARTDAEAGSPEVKLGLIPGLGASYRLPALLGAAEGMKLVLTGKTLDAEAARSAGLFDEVVPERHLRTAARAAIRKGKRGKKAHKSFKEGALDTRPARALTARQMRKKTSEKLREEHYPAPFRMIDAFEEYGVSRDLLEEETDLFVDLARTKTSRNLRRVFMLREKMKHQAELPPGKLEIGHVHVIGAGEMGAEIAAWAALKGFEVSLTDIDRDVLAKAVQKAHRLFETEDDEIKSRGDLRPPRNRFIADLAGDGVKKADLVIDALPEKLELKSDVFGELEGRMKDTALIATNTSSLRLKDMAGALKKPGRLVGLHFFNPVRKMPLVEVVKAGRTTKRAMTQAAAFAVAIDKTAVACADSPGFIVNRALTPYLLEAARMLEEGYKPELIDAAAERFGMAQGPVEVADHVGLDIALDVARHLKEAFPEQVGEIPQRICDLVEEGHFGVKSGRGFYTYQDGEPEKDDLDDDECDPESLDAMADRLILPLLNACAALIREEVVSDSDEIDAALIFGAGFAPFRGGPITYARERGVKTVVSSLKALQKEHEAARFKPDDGWKSLTA